MKKLYFLFLFIAAFFSAAELLRAQSLGDFRTRQTGNWNDTNTWQTFNGSSWFAATNAPTSASGVVTIQSGHTVTNTANVTVDQVIVQAGGQITINSGVTLTVAAGVGTDLDVSGTVQNAGTISLVGTMVVESGGTYRHAGDGGAIPTATWNSNSTCEITGTIATFPTGFGQSFGNLTLNNPGQTVANRSFDGVLTVSGTFAVKSTGTTPQEVRLATGVNQVGNFSQSGGTLRLSSGTARTLVVTNGFSLVGGTFEITTGNGTGTLNVGGNFSHSAGTISAVTGTGSITFNGSGAQTYTSGGTPSGAINFTVNTGATLLTGTNLVGNGSTGTFTNSSGATLGVGDASGIAASGASGNVRVTGTRSFNTGANYIYNGTAAQVTGNGLPATVNNLTVSNSAGVTLTAAVTVNGTLTLTSGILAATANPVSLSTSGSVSGAGASSYVNGTVQKAFGVASGQSFTFPVGDGSSYAPIGLTSLNVTTAGSLTAKTVGSEHPNISTAEINTNKDATRYWTLTNSPAGIVVSSSTATFNFAPGDVDAGANTSAFIVRRFSGSWSSPATGSSTSTSLQATGLNAFGDFIVGEPAGIDHYTVAGSTPQTAGIPFAATVTAQDVFNQTVPDSSTVVTMTGTGGVQFDSNGDAVFGDNTKTLTGGTLTISTRANIAGSITITATDGNGKTGISPAITINPSAPWYNAAWSFRKPITIYHTNIAANLTNFPMLIDRTDIDLQNHALTNGYDILFTSSDGTNKLAHEIDTYTGSNGTLAAWVNVSNVSSTVDTVLYMYYGNPAATNQQNVAGVWDPNFKAVWHLRESGNGTAGEYKDSTTNANNGQGKGGAPTQTIGYIGNGQSFNGTSNYIVSGNNIGISGGTPRTISFWTRMNNTNRTGLVGWGTNAVDAEFEAAVRDNGQFFLWGYGAGNDWTNVAIPQTNSWHYHAIIYDGTVARWYVDGTLLGGGFTNNYATTNTQVTIGYEADAGQAATNYLSGAMDEVRISSVVRPAAWMQTEYVSQNSPATFYGASGQQAAAPTQLAIVSINGGLSPTAGTGFSVVVQAQDANGNPASVTVDTVVTLSLKTGSGLFGGTLTGTITAGNSSVTISGATYTKAESGVALTASRTSGNSLTAGNSSSFSVNPGAFAQMQVLMPGETAAPGTATGKTGTLAAQTVNTSFNVTVYAVDANWNLINTNDTVHMTSSDGSALLPADAALLSGSGSFSVTFRTAGSQTVTASDVTHPGIAANTGSSTSVSAGNQTITFPSPGNQTYGVTPIGLGATASSGLPVSYSVTSGPATVSGNTLTITGAGSVTIQAVQAGNANWNAATPVNQIISVAQKSVTGSITADNKPYDGTNTATIATRTLSGVINSDVVSLTGGTATFADKNIGNGKTVTATGLGLSGSNAPNYVLASTTATNTANITAKGLTVTGVSASNKIYDGNTTATVSTNGATLVGVAGGDFVSLSGTATGTFADKTVASNKTVTASGLTLSGADSGNYTLTQPTTTANITAATVAGHIAVDNKVYDGTTSATITNRTLTGVLGSDTVSLTGGSATFSDKNVANGKTVTATSLSLAGGDAGNYTLSPTNVTTTANITAATVAGHIAVDNKIYDGTATATITNHTLTGVLGSDTVSLTGGSATFSDKNVANGKTVTATSLSLAGGDAGNYTLSPTNVTTTANITAATVAGHIAVDNKVYDGTATATITNRTLTGVLGSDNVSLTGGSATFSDKNVADGKTVTATGLSLAGGDAGNYTLSPTDVTTTANITAATVTGHIAVDNKVYDGTTSATITNRTLTGVLGSDTVSLTGGSATFSDKNVADGKTVTATGLSLAGGDAGNYTLSPTNVTTTANISAATVTGHIAVDNKVYDGTTSATITNRTLTGVLGSDDVSLTGGSATYADKNVANGKTVTATGLSLSGTNAGNYSLTSTSATTAANITAATLTVIADNQGRAYGAANPALTVHYTGFSSGDDTNVLSGSPALSTTATTSSPAGNYPITVSQSSLSAANYIFALVDGTLTVGKATLTVTADDQSRAYGQLNPVFTVSYSGFLGSDDTNVLSGTPTVSSSADTNSPVAGSPYSITVTNGTLSATNYDFAFVAGQLTVTQTMLTISADNLSMVYETQMPPFTASYTGFVNGENTNALSGAPDLTTTATTSCPVGNYPINIGQGTLSSTNYSFNLIDGTLTVHNLNHPPVLSPITNAVIRPDGGLMFAASASDTDGDQLTFSLDPGAPAGALITNGLPLFYQRIYTNNPANTTNGTFVWSPTRANASTTNTITVRVTDNGVPPMSSTQTFTVIVLDYLQVTIASTNVIGGNTVDVPISLASSDDVTNLMFALQWPSDRFTNSSLTLTPPTTGSSSMIDQVTNLLIKIRLDPGQVLQSTQQIARLNFFAVTNQYSAFVPLPVESVSAIKPNGSAYTNYIADAGTVAVVTDNPLLAAKLVANLSTNLSRTLTAYGNIGVNYQLQYTTNLTLPGWNLLLNYTQTNSVINMSVDPTIPVIFYRLYQP